MTSNTKPINIPVHNGQSALPQSCPPNFILLNNQRPPLYPNTHSLSPQTPGLALWGCNQKAKSNLSLSLSPTTSYYSQSQSQYQLKLNASNMAYTNTTTHNMEYCDDCPFDFSYDILDMNTNSDIHTETHKVGNDMRANEPGKDTTNLLYDDYYDDDDDSLSVFHINNQKMRPCWLFIGKEMHERGML